MSSDSTPDSSRAESGSAGPEHQGSPDGSVENPAGSSAVSHSDAALAALREASDLVDAVGQAARAATEAVAGPPSSEAAVIAAAIGAAQVQVSVEGEGGQFPGAEGGGDENWDDDDELGWAIGSELEFLEDEGDEWDGPVGDGLDEEEGLGGIAVSKDPAADKAAIDAAARAEEDPAKG